MKAQAVKIVNGVSLGILMNTKKLIKKNPIKARTKFHSVNKWHNGSFNEGLVTNFYNDSKMVMHKRVFKIQSDEPEMLAGNDLAPNPVEHLLNSLAACLTTSIVYHAAARGINIYEMESQIEGTLDLRGYLGLSNTIRKGCNKISVKFNIKSDTDDLEKLKYLTYYSPVFDMVNHGTPIEIEINSR